MPCPGTTIAAKSERRVAAVMKRSGDKAGAQGQPLSQHRWKGAQSIELAHQLNQQVIEFCCELALDRAAPHPIPPVELHRDLWGHLDPDSRRRLSRLPFVIVDLKFDDVAWWHMAAGNGVHARGHSAGAAPAARREWLALETLMFSWQVAREDRGVALMLFAMSPPVVDCIAALTMQQVRTLAVESATFLRLRWDSYSRLWRELLIAAREPDEAELDVLRREAKLQFCGDLIHAHIADGIRVPLTGEIEMRGVRRH